MVSINAISVRPVYGRFRWRRFTMPRFALLCPEKMQEPDIKHRTR